MESLATKSLSIKSTFAGRNVLVTGASGFVGKVWLAMLLDRVEDVGRVYVLLRRKGLRKAPKRFERIVNTSPVFAPLHAKHGANLSRFLAERIEVLDGDISEPDLGLTPAVADRVRTDLDLVVNCAGLVDFNPDPRDSLLTNVDGALNVAEFVSRSDRARMVHVSTCYVAGNVSGRIPETLRADYRPDGGSLDVETELREVREDIDRLVAEFDCDATRRDIEDSVQRRMAERELDPADGRLATSMFDAEYRKRLGRILSDHVRLRAEALGWPNIYTYSKSLAESVVALRYPHVAMTTVRPAVVESSVSFPFPGWNEGFNTSGPVVYLLGTWYRHLPSSDDHPFDVVPVDYLCNAMFIASAALLNGTHAPVYHCGTSDRNMVTVARTCELTALGHRRYYRKHGTSAVERMVLSRWDGQAVVGDHLLSLQNIRRAARGVSGALQRVSSRLPAAAGKSASRAADVADLADRQLRGVEKVIGMFLPFVHDNAYVFETPSYDRHQVTEPEFRFEPETIDWRHYWLEVQMPGLREWCYPVIQGRPIKEFKPAIPFKLAAPVDRAADVSTPALAAG